MITRRTWYGIVLLVALLAAGVAIWRWGTSPVLPDVTIETIHPADRLE